MLRRVNRVFRLGPDDTPGPSLFSWTGGLEVEPGGPPAELAVPAGGR